MTDPSDPILVAIAAYRAGLTDFNANAPEDDLGANAYAEVSYGPPMRTIEQWSAPAATHEGAVEALRLARDADETGDSDMVGAMLKASLGFFEAELRFVDEITLIQERLSKLQAGLGKSTTSETCQ